MTDSNSASSGSSWFRPFSRARNNVPAASQPNSSDSTESPQLQRHPSPEQPVCHSTNFSPSPSPSPTTTTFSSPRRPPVPPRPKSTTNLHQQAQQHELRQSPPSRLHVPHHSRPSLSMSATLGRRPASSNPLKHVSSFLKMELHGLRGSHKERGREQDVLGDDVDREKDDQNQVEEEVQDEVAKDGDEEKVKKKERGRKAELHPAMKILAPTSTTLSPLMDSSKEERRDSYGSRSGNDSTTGRNAQKGRTRDPLSEWHSPKVWEMMETLKSVMMTKDARDGLPAKYSSYVLTLLEGFICLTQRLHEATNELSELKTLRDKELEEFRDLSEEWLQRENDYKAEIKRLELVLAKESKDGVGCVAVSRHNSIVDRSGSKRFQARVKRARSPQRGGTSGSRHRGFGQDTLTAQLTDGRKGIMMAWPTQSRPPSANDKSYEISATLPRILDSQNDVLMSRFIERREREDRLLNSHLHLGPGTTYNPPIAQDHRRSDVKPFEPKAVQGTAIDRNTLAEQLATNMKGSESNSSGKDYGFEIPQRTKPQRQPIFTISTSDSGSSTESAIEPLSSSSGSAVEQHHIGNQAKDPPQITILTSPSVDDTTKEELRAAMQEPLPFQPLSEDIALSDRTTRCFSFQEGDDRVLPVLSPQAWESEIYDLERIPHRRGYWEYDKTSTVFNRAEIEQPGTGLGNGMTGHTVENSDVKPGNDVLFPLGPDTDASPASHSECLCSSSGLGPDQPVYLQGSFYDSYLHRQEFPEQARMSSQDRALMNGHRRLSHSESTGSVVWIGDSVSQEEQQKKSDTIKKNEA